ncbi:hypothetical protein F2Q69_00005633 [Brassica cretica]|uniref:FATC domain-containing protein n=1 Tax=Brassica cretica TaxID=69181 RepID=A0A8S9P5V4_BRACR|nr:hypothetical protein F2Q69_00005633 [Brassica cretica]
MITSRDVHEVVWKLSSDKAKTREDGVKLLNTWLEGDMSINFCSFLSHNTAKLKLDQIPNAETWPFLVKNLLQCVSMEVSGSKRRIPKPTFAKALRVVIQRAEETKFPGVLSPLLSMAKTIFTHVHDILSNTPSFHSEYGIILRHLLEIKEYRFQMRKRTYSNLVMLYIERAEAGFWEKNSGQHSQKEEAFRCILTLQSLLENPPGDFSDDIRKEIVNGLIHIFSSARDEEKLSRKLIECVNSFLLKDGPNIGSLSLEIHNAVQQFVFRCWLTTHDKNLKEILAFYGRLQLNLTRGSSESSSLVEQLLNVVTSELDLGSSSSSASWGDSTKDGTLSSYQNSLVELAAHVLYRLDRGWQLIWSSLIHGLATFSSMTVIVDAVLVLLGSIISNNHINVGILPQEVWDHQLFRHIPSEKGKGSTSIFLKACQYLLESLDYAVEAVLKSLYDFQRLGPLGFGSDFNEKSSIIVSLRSLTSSPVFSNRRDQNLLATSYDTVFHSLEDLLRSFAKVYGEYTEHSWNTQSDTVTSKSLALDPPEVGRIVDMDLDLDVDTKEIDLITAGGKAVAGGPVSTGNWKLGMISLISCFSPVLQFPTWDVLYSIMEKECDPKVLENILYHLCQLSCLTSMPKVYDLNKRNCLNIVTALHVLLQNLLSGMDSSGLKPNSELSLLKGESCQIFVQLGAMVNKVSECGLLGWFGRVRLISCICNFVLLNPRIGQTMIERLLLMLNDSDYRVRFVLARQIGLLFQTWDGHEALFQDICSVYHFSLLIASLMNFSILSSFGIILVTSSKENLVTARDVLAAGPQPRPKMETVIITLMHLAYHNKYLKPAVSLAKNPSSEISKRLVDRQSQTWFHLAHYADALFKSYEERLSSSEWQAAMRLRKHKGEQSDYSLKIQELQKQLTMDKEEAEKLQVDRDNFLKLALEGYQRCLQIGDKYDVRVVPVVTATIPVDRSCQYNEGSFPSFRGLSDSVTVMNGINAPKVVECFGSDGRKYKQLAKSGNDDLRQDAVFIHDPLYKWALSPLKALQRQKETEDYDGVNLEGLQEEFEGNKDAARALMRVKQKLDGYEGGEMRSIHGQAQQLIQDAIDTDRLSHMFPGWGAWMRVLEHFDTYFCIIGNMYLGLAVQL